MSGANTMCKVQHKIERAVQQRTDDIYEMKADMCAIHFAMKTLLPMCKVRYSWSDKMCATQGATCNTVGNGAVQQRPDDICLQ